MFGIGNSPNYLVKHACTIAVQSDSSFLIWSSNSSCLAPSLTGFDFRSTSTWLVEGRTMIIVVKLIHVILPLMKISTNYGQDRDYRGTCEVEIAS